MRTKLPKRAVLVPNNATRVFQGIIYDVYQWKQELFDGTTTTFEMLKRPDSINVIAVKDNKIVVLEEEQPNQGLFYDVPGGKHDHTDENELQAAKRELLEETGLSFKSWRLLSIVQPYVTIERFFYTFLATDFDSEIEPQPDAGERITVQLLSFDEAKSALASEKGRSLPSEVKKTNSIDELLSLPEYS